MPINILFNFPSWYTAVTPRTVTPKDAPNCNKSGITDTNQYMNVLLLSLFPFFAVIFWCLTAIISWTLMPKYWIGNERKRRGLTSKRGPREPINNTLKYVPGQKRKKSSYSVFKSTFLSGEKGKYFVYSMKHTMLKFWLILCIPHWSAFCFLSETLLGVTNHFLVILFARQVDILDNHSCTWGLSHAVGLGVDGVGNSRPGKEGMTTGNTKSLGYNIPIL